MEETAGQIDAGVARITERPGTMLGRHKLLGEMGEGTWAWSTTGAGPPEGGPDANEWTANVVREAEQGTMTLAWNRQLALNLLHEETAALTGNDHR